MLERLLAGLLAGRLGRFVDGLDEDNLTVCLSSGGIALEGLKLKVRGAFRLPATTWAAAGAGPVHKDWTPVHAHFPSRVALITPHNDAVFAYITTQLRAQPLPSSPTLTSPPSSPLPPT